MIKTFLTNLGKYNEGDLVGEWIDLPISKENFKKVLDSIQIGNEYEEYFFTDFDCEVTGLQDSLGEFENIYILNKLAELLIELDSYDIKKLEAILEFEAHNSVIDVINSILAIDDFIFQDNISNEEDLGVSYVEEGLLGDIPTQVQCYIDYESLGRDLVIDFAGAFTSNGFIYGYPSKYYEDVEEILKEFDCATL